ncbi:MAG TPA: hypothetical protein VN700_16605 [Vicinamibacterales bacterium]|nr:hypothetical protein [Vicinamibacterales bacterium]
MISAGRAAVLFVVISAALTWPQVIHPFSVPDNIDAYFNIWRVSWFAHQLFADPSHLLDANIYYPVQGTLLFSDAVLLQGLVAVPFLKLGIPAVLVTNALIFSGFVASALGMFLLARELTGRTLPAVLGAVVFAFAPFRFDHYFHLEMGWAQWMPLALWAVHRTFSTGRLSTGLVAGLCIALQGYSAVYYLIFLAAGLVIAAPPLIWQADARMRWPAIRSLAAGAVLAGVLLAPYMKAYAGAAAATGGRSRQQALYSYAAGPKHYVATMPSSLLYGGTLGSLGQHEKRLFPGFLVLGLAAFSLWPPFDRRRLAYALMLAFAIDLSFAHRGLLPGWLYDHVFAFRGLRVPPRVGQLMLMALGVLAAFGLSRLMDAVRSRRPDWASAVGAATIALTCVEYASRPMTLVPVDTAPSAVAAWLHSQPRGVVAEFPAPGPVSEGVPEVYYQYASTFHWQPLLNGYSGMYPTPYVRWIEAMKSFPDDAAMAVLAGQHVRYIVLHEKYFAAGQYQQTIRALAQRTDLVAYGPFPDGAGEARVYRLLSTR